MTFPPKAKKAAPIVQAGREHLQKTSDIIHQHRLSLASQLKIFDSRWAELFSTTPVLNKLTKGRQKPDEFKQNTEVLLDDVQVALRDAHNKKGRKKDRDQDSIIPDPLPVSLSIRETRAVYPIAEEEEEPEVKSIVKRMRSKLKRKKAIKRKSSRPGLSRFNPFRKRVIPTNNAPSSEAVEPRKVKNKSSRQSLPSSYGSRSRSSHRSPRPRHRTSRRHLREQHPEPPVIPTEFKPYLPEPPMLPPMKFEMSSLGYYNPSSPVIPPSAPPPQPDYRYRMDSSVAPNSPQPYYLSVKEQKPSPRNRSHDSSSRSYTRSARRKASRDLKDDSRRHRSHRHRSDRERRRESSDSRSDRDRHRGSRDRSDRDRRHESHDRRPHEHSRSHRRHDESQPRDKYSYSYSSHPHSRSDRHHDHYSRDSHTRVPTQSASSYARHHDSHRFWQPTEFTPSPERSRFKENFSILHSP